MGKRNTQIGAYLSDPERFADMCNAIYFHGKQLILPSDLADMDTVLYEQRTKGGEEARPDHVKRWTKKGMDYAILIQEEQNQTDYHMVLRVILSEALYYRNQWKNRQRRHQKTKDLKTPEAFLSGMQKTEKFTPVVTLVVNLGEKPWDGPRTLYELLDMNEANRELKEYINDYKLNIFDYHDYENFDIFQTELRAIFEFLRFSKDIDKLKNTVEKNTELYYNISIEAYDIISELTHSRELLPPESRDNYIQEGDRINMCKALQDLKNEGITQGLLQKLVELTLRKLTKGKKTEEIASELEEDPDTIRKIVSIAEKHAPEYNITEILVELSNVEFLTN